LYKNSDAPELYLLWGTAYCLRMAKKKSTQKRATRKPVGAKAAKKNAVGSPKGIRQQVWPQERDVMMRPDRLRYVRKLVVPDGCVFCAAAKAKPEFESLLLYRSELAMVVLNKYPYNNGHLLVLPVRHEGDITALTDAEGAELQRLLRESVRILKDNLGTDGFNVGLNLGKVAGAGIPEHLHYHIVPRWAGDTNFFPLLAETKVVIETLEQTFERLLPLFNSL
jgi:ATP adenylyltransferase